MKVDNNTNRHLLAVPDNTMEVKRMYVPPENRGRGIAAMVLKELEL